ncbi:MAG: hypothetical protein AB7G93_15250 [Bdellovibrionales bacterium]
MSVARKQTRSQKLELKKLSYSVSRRFSRFFRFHRNTDPKVFKALSSQDQEDTLAFFREQWLESVVLTGIYNRDLDDKTFAAKMRKALDDYQKAARQIDRFDMKYSRKSESIPTTSEEVRRIEATIVESMTENIAYYPAPDSDAFNQMSEQEQQAALEWFEKDAARSKRCGLPVIK